MLKNNEHINFNSVVTRACVSKGFIYKNDILRNRIELLRTKQQEVRKLHTNKTRMTDKSKDILLVAKNKKIQELEAENTKLKVLLKRNFGMEYDKL
jgi:hypothetical protein